jgi:hypothetical protein
MDPDPPYRLDIHGLTDEDTAVARDSAASGGRPWLGILFDCCGVYSRVYRDANGRGYAGRCPSCLKKISLRVGPGGTDARFFVAGP